MFFTLWRERRAFYGLLLVCLSVSLPRFLRFFRPYLIVRSIDSNKSETCNVGVLFGQLSVFMGQKKLAS
jgi:hypothetical protein